MPGLRMYVVFPYTFNWYSYSVLVNTLASNLSYGNVLVILKYWSFTYLLLYCPCLCCHSFCSNVWSFRVEANLCWNPISWFIFAHVSSLDFHLHMSLIFVLTCVKREMVFRFAVNGHKAKKKTNKKQKNP